MSEKIISVLKKSPGISATTIAHELGYSKANSIRKDLDALLASGQVVEDTSGRFATYSLAASLEKKKVIEKTTAVVDSSTSAKELAEELPAAAEHDLQGYKIQDISYQGKKMKRITTPDGRNIRMESDDKLMVINGKPQYVIKTAEDALNSIRKYTLDHGLTVFTIDDIKQNKKISGEKDLMVSDDHVLFLSIKKHNKAAVTKAFIWYRFPSGKFVIRHK